MKMITRKLGLELKGEVFPENTNGVFQLVTISASGMNANAHGERIQSRKRESLGLKTQPWNVNDKGEV